MIDAERTPVRSVTEDTGTLVFQVWDLDRSKKLFEKSLATQYLPDCVLSADGRWFAYELPETAICLKDLQKDVPEIQFPLKPAPSTFALSPNGDRIAFEQTEGSLTMTERDGDHRSDKYEGHKGSLSPLVFSPDGLSMATGSDDRSVRLWKIGDQPDADARQAMGEMIDSIATTSDGHFVAYGTDFHLLYQLPGNANFMTSVAISPNGRYLICAGSDAGINIWDLRKRVLIHTLTGHSDEVTGLAFSHDGRLIASCSSDRKVIIWNFATRRVLKSFAGHEGPVNEVDFSSDDSLVVSGSEDGTARLWDVKTGEEVSTFRFTMLSTVPVVFSPAGNLLVVGGDGVNVFRAASEETVKRQAGIER